MRLINAKTLKLEEFIDGRSAPKYAILSHTWCKDEVLFHDMARLHSVARQKKGWKKIELTCAQTLKDGLGYAWVDTCCIDKSSSAELSEAINSMFAWYRGSAVCYVYLYDVHTDPLQHGDLSRLFSDTITNDEKESAEIKPSIFEIAPQLAQSRWFTRGWTLQELLAPKSLQIFSRDWSYLGSGGDLGDIISSITPIKASVLRGVDGIGECSVACRMSWAAPRTTTRTEDEAYCLLGIFGINMPLLYGEGRRAFSRLQKEIIRISNDQTILAWKGIPPKSDSFSQLGFDAMAFGGEALADCVSAFADCGSYSPVRRPIPQSSVEVTRIGIEATVRVARRRRNNDIGEDGVHYREYAVLNCVDERQPTGLLALEIKPSHFYSNRGDFSGHYVVGSPGVPLPWRELEKDPRLERVVLDDTSERRNFVRGSSAAFRIRCIVSDARLYSVQVLEMYPAECWEPDNIYRADESVRALKIMVNEQQMTGELMTTSMAVYFQHTYYRRRILLQEVPGTGLSLGATCDDLAKDQTGWKQFYDNSSYYMADSFDGPCFAVGPYNVCVTCISQPVDDCHPNLTLLIYRRINVLRTLADFPKVLFSLATWVYLWIWKVLATSPRDVIESAILGPEEIPVEEDYSAPGLVSCDLSKYGTRWQRYRMRSMKVQRNDRRWKSMKLRANEPRKDIDLLAGMSGKAELQRTVDGTH